MTDVVAEFYKCGLLQLAHIDQLTSAGVPIGALAFVARDFVVPSGMRFEFRRYTERHHNEAVPAYIVMAFDDEERVADFAAWKPGAFLATWCGAVGMLGEEHVHRPRLGHPLTVHPNAQEWMKDNRQGVVVVDPVRSASLLRDAGKLSVASMEQGQALRRSLAVPLPEIVVRQAIA